MDLSAEPARTQGYGFVQDFLHHHGIAQGLQIGRAQRLQRLLLDLRLGLGLGRALTEACIQCAKEAGYEQLELTVVAENERAIALYRKAGFVEFGRNPRGFRSRTSGYQEIVHMLLAL